MYEICKICGDKKATASHVKTHGLSYEEYRKKYEKSAPKGKKVAIGPNKTSKKTKERTGAKPKKSKPDTKLDSKAQDLHDIMFTWDLEGYDVSDLKKRIDKKDFPNLIKSYEIAIDKLKDIEGKLNKLDTEGHEAEAVELRKMLKNPKKVIDATTAFGELTQLMEEDFFTFVVKDGVKFIEPSDIDDDEDERKSSSIMYMSEEDLKSKDAGGNQDSKLNVEKGFCYLIEEEKPDKSYRIFKDLVEAGNEGLCITRDFPTKVKKKFKLPKMEILWLSNSEEEYAFSPVELGKLMTHIERFLVRNEDSVIMLSGLEYLITQNNYSTILKLIQLLNEQVAMRGSMLILPVSPLALEKRDLKLIERELEVLN